MPERQIFVIFWPEDSTWNDDAITTVDRNRVTFMRFAFNLTCISYESEPLIRHVSARYLTKITDQIIALISEEHGKKLVWTEDKEGDSAETFDEVEFDRMYTYEVSKMNEREEDVTILEGFSVRHPCWVSP